MRRKMRRKIGMVGLSFTMALSWYSGAEVPSAVAQVDARAMEQSRVAAIEPVPTDEFARPDAFTEQVMEWEEQGIDPNHTEAREKVMAYIDANVPADVFASMHIDRDERELGILVFSFTEEIDEAHKQAMRDLVEEPAEIAFRQVRYTEEELHAKQREIDLNALEDDGIAIYHTSSDIIGDQVEIGIDPFNEQSVQIVHDHFGEEMIHVVEGHQMQLLDGGGDTPVAHDVMDESDSDNVDTLNGAAPATDAADVNAVTEEMVGEEGAANRATATEEAAQTVADDHPSLLQRLFQSVRNWFQSIF